MGTPVTVLGGYLGAGKTTILNAVLGAPHGLRIAVVVNDFGSVNVDAALIGDRAARRIDLTNGCVCCQVGDDLGEVCFQLVEADPPFDRIVIEASGVADPAQVASWASLPGLQLDGVVVVVDPDSIERLLVDPLVGPTVRRQLVAADVAVVTRADLVDPETIERVAEVLVEHGLAAPVVTSAAGAVPLAALFDLAVGTAPSDRPTAPTDPTGHGHIAAVWRPHGAVDPDLLREALAAVPGLVRAKGIVPVTTGGDAVVHLAGRRITVEAWPADGEHGNGRSGEHVLVGIGHSAVFDPAVFCDRLDATTQA